MIYLIYYWNFFNTLILFIFILLKILNISLNENGFWKINNVVKGKVLYYNYVRENNNDKIFLLVNVEVIMQIIEGYIYKNYKEKIN